MSKTIEELSKIAAEWCAEHVVGSSAINTRTPLMRNTLTVEDKQRLVETLSDEIQEKFKTKFYRDKGVILIIESGPSGLLSEVMNTVGISNGNSPWKTSLVIRENCISVFYDYGSRIQYLYANKEYWIRQKTFFEDLLSKCDIENYFDCFPEETREEIKSSTISDLRKSIQECEINLQNAEE